AASTLSTERTHIGHLRAGLAPTSPVESLTKAQLQAYADRRTRSVSPATVRKELATLGYIWRWGIERGHVHAPVPSLAVTCRKQAEKEPFRTWSEVEAMIASGEGGEARTSRLWESLHLDEEQVREVLEHVRGAAAEEFLYPMVAFAAYTGARRSEIVASERADFDFARRVVLIREKKRKHSAGGSYRHVLLHSSLASIVSDWFAGWTSPRMAGAG
ncbi:MAG TPA: tyrosine-type recombinase/integrase, partial [Isosphaeraceae bacterium]